MGKDLSINLFHHHVYLDWKSSGNNMYYQVVLILALIKIKHHTDPPKSILFELEYDKY